MDEQNNLFTYAKLPKLKQLEVGEIKFGQCVLPKNSKALELLEKHLRAVLKSYRRVLLSGKTEVCDWYDAQIYALSSTIIQQSNKGVKKMDKKRIEAKITSGLPLTGKELAFAVLYMGYSGK